MKTDLREPQQLQHRRISSQLLIKTLHPLKRRMRFHMLIAQPKEIESEERIPRRPPFDRLAAMAGRETTEASAGCELPVCVSKAVEADDAGEGLEEGEGIVV